MLVNCRKGCVLNGGITTVKLNLDTDKVICDFCEEEVPDLSSFAKESLRTCGSVIRDRVIESFTFFCNFCEQNVKTAIKNDIPCGKDCGDVDNCSINISDEMISAIKSMRGEVDGADDE